MTPPTALLAPSLPPKLPPSPTHLRLALGLSPRTFLTATSPTTITSVAGVSDDDHISSCGRKRLRVFDDDGDNDDDPPTVLYTPCCHPGCKGKTSSDGPSATLPCLGHCGGFFHASCGAKYAITGGRTCGDCAPVSPAST